MKWICPVLASITSALLLSSCATFTRTEGLMASVVNVMPQQASLFETSAGITLRLTSEATEPMSLRGSTHRLFLNGTYVGRGVSGEPVSLPAFGTATQTVTVYVENLKLIGKFSEFQNAPPATIDYRLESEFHSADRRRSGSLRTIATGELDVRALMNAAGGMAAPAR